MSNARDKANIPALNFSSTGIDDNATSTAITIDSSERVGIGTSSPAKALHVVSGTFDDGVRIESTDLRAFIGTLDNTGSTYFGNSGADFVVYTGGDTAGNGSSEKMRISSNGSLSIGTTSVSPKLYVVSNSNQNGMILDCVGTPANYHFDVRNDNSSIFRIDSSGNVGIGTTSPENNLHIFANNGGEGLTIKSTGNTSNAIIIDANRSNAGNTINQLLGRWNGTDVADISFQTGSDTTNKDNGIITFRTSSANNISERMRIDSSGNVGIGTSSPSYIFHVQESVSGNIVSEIDNSSAQPYGLQLKMSAVAPDNNTNYFLNCRDSGTNRLRIYSDGDVKNHDNSYGAISDERIKQDIRDSNSQWNDIKNIRVRNFKKKDDVRHYGENAWEQIGVVAQELETVSPKLIKHSDPTSSDILSDSSFGTLYEEGDEIPEGKNIGDVKEVHQQVKGVSYSVLYMKAIKALQEAMERIETLEAKVQTLETNNP